MFLKYKDKWAHSNGDFEFRFLGDLSKSTVEDIANYAEDIIEEMANEFNWSDKFRGMEWFLIEDSDPEIPDEFIIRQITSSNNHIKFLERNVEVLNKIMDDRRPELLFNHPI